MHFENFAFASVFVVVSLCGVTLYIYLYASVVATVCSDSVHMTWRATVIKSKWARSAKVHPMF